MFNKKTGGLRAVMWLFLSKIFRVMAELHYRLGGWFVGLATRFQIWGGRS